MAVRKGVRFGSSFQRVTSWGRIAVAENHTVRHERSETETPMRCK